jgi:SAM-dependent methyltransferase
MISKEKMEEWDRQGRIYFPKEQTSRLRRKSYADELKGMPIQNLWQDIAEINSRAAERLGYPTQKPEALLERIINASSAEGETVLDPFCGCGTAVAAAQSLERQWIGIDVTHLAIKLIKGRLADAFGEKIVDTYAVVGEPTDLESAKALADQDKYQFQYWALGLAHQQARPEVSQQKKGADKGIDGRLNLIDSAGEVSPILFSVKGGHVTVSQIRDLRGVVEREGAAMGVFICIEDVTAPMRMEAADAGFYQSKAIGETRHPKLQILTIQDLMDGKKIDMPAHADVRSIKVAPKAKGKKQQQHALPFDGEPA